MRNFFDKMNIKTFEWSELDGKTLQIVAGKQDEAMIVVGRDIDTQNIYVLHEEINTLQSRREDI